MTKVRIIHDESQDVLWEAETDFMAIPRKGERIMTDNGVYEVHRIDHLITSGTFIVEQEVNILVH